MKQKVIHSYADQILSINERYELASSKKEKKIIENELIELTSKIISTHGMEYLFEIDEEIQKKSKKNN